ncbi:MAG: hypothetical protein J6B41_07280 [Alistipes sp.]|nr:hypothetical protein [Alistipes sp.]
MASDTLICFSIFAGCGVFDFLDKTESKKLSATILVELYHAIRGVDLRIIILVTELYEHSHLHYACTVLMLRV